MGDGSKDSDNLDLPVRPGFGPGPSSSTPVWGMWKGQVDQIEALRASRLRDSCVPPDAGADEVRDVVVKYLLN